MKFLQPEKTKEVLREVMTGMYTLIVGNLVMSPLIMPKVFFQVEKNPMELFNHWRKKQSKTQAPARYFIFLNWCCGGRYHEVVSEVYIQNIKI